MFKATTSAKGTSKIQETLRTIIFSGTEKDLYQRVTRSSRPYKGQPQLVGVLTGLGKQAEVKVLSINAGGMPKLIGGWESNKEAVDCDFIATGENEYLFGYCDEYDVWVAKVSGGKVSDEPTSLYVTPASTDSERPQLPAFKGLRWLTKDYLAMLSNVHGGNGVVIQILRLPPSGNGPAAVVQSIWLPSSVSKATAFEVANLTPPTTPSDSQGYTQFIIAVAGHDISIHLYKIDLQVEIGINLVQRIQAFRTLKKVHPIQITSLAFSNFTAPSQPITAQTPAQHLKLSSTSMSGTVVVHTLPLFPVPLSVKRGQSKSPRYVVAIPSKTFSLGFLMFLSVILVGLASVFAESFVEIRGGPPSRMGTTKYIPLKWQHALGKPYEFPPGYSSSLNTPAPTSAYSTEFETPTTTITVVPAPAQSADSAGVDLQDLVKQAQATGGDGVVIINDLPEAEGVTVDVHDEEVHGPGKKWEDLPAKQKEGWKKKLSEAGHWAEDMGETLFKGVLFGELAGAVGHAVAGG